MSSFARRNMFFLVPAVLLALFLAVIAFLRFRTSMGSQYFLYIGGYGSSAVKCVFNAKNLESTVIGDYKAVNPSYLCLTPAAKKLYGVSESGATSGVWGYVCNSGHPLGSRQDGGADPCYLTYYRGHVFTANYGKGGISVYPADTLGGIKKRSQVVSFVSSEHRKVSRVHTVRIVRGKRSGNDYLLATDKGLDRVYVLRIVEDTTLSKEGNLLFGKALKLVNTDSSFVSVPAGYGPRHIELSKDGRMMYLLCETSGRILTYTMNEVGNNLIFRQLQDIVADRNGNKASADIHLSPDGNFLYASIRKGTDGIVVFKVDEDGTLARMAFIATGSYPRSFTISPDGEFMFVCCQKDKCVQILRIDKATGNLINTRKKIVFQVLEPSCILISSI